MGIGAKDSQEMGLLKGDRTKCVSMVLTDREIYSH